VLLSKKEIYGAFQPDSVGECSSVAKESLHMCEEINRIMGSPFQYKNNQCILDTFAFLFYYMTLVPEKRKIFFSIT